MAQELLELVRFTSTNLPADVEKVLREAYENEEEGAAARDALTAAVLAIATFNYYISVAKDVPFWKRFLKWQASAWG